MPYLSTRRRSRLFLEGLERRASLTSFALNLPAAHIALVTTASPAQQDELNPQPLPPRIVVTGPVVVIR